MHDSDHCIAEKKNLQQDYHTLIHPSHIRLSAPLCPQNTDKELYITEIGNLDRKKRPQSWTMISASVTIFLFFVNWCPLPLLATTESIHPCVTVMKTI